MGFPDSPPSWFRLLPAIVPVVLAILAADFAAVHRAMPAVILLAFAAGLWVHWPQRHVRRRLQVRNDQLGRANSKLERLLAEHQENVKRLEVATREAVAASEAKSAFLASMSHEIRTPINGLMGFARLLEDTPLSRTQKEYVDIINGSGRALLTVINDILDFSKLEAGRLAVSIEPFDFRVEVTNVADLLGATATEKGVTLAMSCPDNVNMNGLGDSGRVRQVLLNLVGNAVKFTETGHVLIEVRNDPESGYIRCLVHDTGIGISPDAQENLFEQFVQGDYSTTRRFGGSGLGLAISRSLVEMMDGDIGFSSEPGRGSTFWFTVPPAAEAPQAVEILPPTVPENARILILESEAINRQVMAEQLSLWGVEHFMAATVDEAIRLLGEDERRRHGWTAVLIPHDCAARQDGLAEMLVDLAGVGLKILSCTRPGVPLDAHVLPGVTMHFILAAPLGRRDRLWEMVESLNREIPVTGDTCLIENWMESPPAPDRGNDENRLRALVAEDNPVNLKLAGKFLQMLGCEVDGVVNGLEAVERSIERDYDIIFMDCHMPECDGYEATRRIRIQENHRGRDPVPIVALTANVLPEGQRESEIAGMNDFITKPVTLDDLKGCLARRIAPPVSGAGDSLAA